MAKSTDVSVASLLVPFPFGRRVIVFPPKALHQFGWLNLKFCSVHFSKLLQGKCPTMEARTKTNCAITRINLKRNIEYVLVTNVSGR